MGVSEGKLGVFVSTIREILGVSVERGHFLVFVNDLLFLGAVQSRY